MRNRYSFTQDGLDNLAVYGIEPGEVWPVLHATRRITRQLNDEANAVFGVTGKGRHLVVFVLQSTKDDTDWDVVAARDMYPDEIALFNQLAGGAR